MTISRSNNISNNYGPAARSFCRLLCLSYLAADGYGFSNYLEQESKLLDGHTKGLTIGQPSSLNSITSIFVESLNKVATLFDQQLNPSGTYVNSNHVAVQVVDKFKECFPTAIKSWPTIPVEKAPSTSLIPTYVTEEESRLQSKTIRAEPYGASPDPMEDWLDGETPQHISSSEPSDWKPIFRRDVVFFKNPTEITQVSFGHLAPAVRKGSRKYANIIQILTSQLYTMASLLPVRMEREEAMACLLESCGWTSSKIILEGCGESVVQRHSLLIVKPSSYRLSKFGISDEVNENAFEIIVDFNFTALFEVARPTKQYEKFLSSIFGVFMGPQYELMECIGVMCDNANESLIRQGMTIPPWRKPGVLRETFHRSLQSRRGYANIQVSTESQEAVCWAIANRKHELASLGFIPITEPKCGALGNLVEAIEPDSLSLGDKTYAPQSTEYVRSALTQELFIYGLGI